MCIRFPGDAPYRAFSRRKADFYSGSQHTSGVEVSPSASLLLALEAPRSTFHAELVKTNPVMDCALASEPVYSSDFIGLACETSGA